MPKSLCFNVRFRTVTNTGADYSPRSIDSRAEGVNRVIDPTDAHVGCDAEPSARLNDAQAPSAKSASSEQLTGRQGPKYDDSDLERLEKFS